jgi:DNA-binding response OmpR family regulator
MNDERPVILCVDDDESELSLRKAILEQEGYWVLVARDVESAIGVCKRHPVSLIIADHMLKGETGVELAGKLNATIPSVPVLMISGTQPDSLRNIDCFLDKGESVQIMLAMVSDLLRRRRA